MDFQNAPRDVYVGEREEVRRVLERRAVLSYRRVAQCRTPLFVGDVLERAVLSHRRAA